jgi:hypothetical protein
MAGFVCAWSKPWPCWVIVKRKLHVFWRCEFGDTRIYSLKPEEAKQLHAELTRVLNESPENA